MEKHYDIIILGAGNIAQALLELCQNYNVLVLSRNAEQLDVPLNVSKRNWTIGESLPPKVSANTVINCVMPADKTIAKEAVDFAKAALSEKGLYLHLSTIALFTRPDSFPSILKFCGDAYIRTKSFELKYVEHHIPSAKIIFPGIVLGETTTWGKFVSDVKSKSSLVVGGSLKQNAPIIQIEHLASEIINLIDNKDQKDLIFLPHPEDKANPSWEIVLDTKSKIIIKKEYLFFHSKFKELITVLLTSSLFPYRLVKILQSRGKIKTSNQTKILNDNGVLSVTGMTHYYMVCKYVL